MKIIVDQNIWYKLGRALSNDNVNANYIKQNLVSTWLNSEEFYYSKNAADLKGKLKEYIFAVKACCYYTMHYNPENPIETLLGYQDQESLKSSLKYWEMLKELARTNLKVKFKLTENDTILKDFKSLIISKKKERVESIVDYLNEKISQDRIKYKTYSQVEKELFKDNMGIENDRITKKLLKKVCEAYFTTEIIRERWHLVNWNDFHLFIYCFKQVYCRKLELGQAFNVNDVFDLFHLLYVGSGDKIWTVEKLWIDIIKTDAQMKKYLFV